MSIFSGLLSGRGDSQQSAGQIDANIGLDANLDASEIVRKVILSMVGGGGAGATAGEAVSNVLTSIGNQAISTITNPLQDSLNVGGILDDVSESSTLGSNPLGGSTDAGSDVGLLDPVSSVIQEGGNAVRDAIGKPTNDGTLWGRVKGLPQNVMRDYTTKFENVIRPDLMPNRLSKGLLDQVITGNDISGSVAGNMDDMESGNVTGLDNQVTAYDAVGMGDTGESVNLGNEISQPKLMFSAIGGGANNVVQPKRKTNFSLSFGNR